MSCDCLSRENYGSNHKLEYGAFVLLQQFETNIVVAVVMGWFSRSSSSSKTEDADVALTRQDRQKCWEARDGYFACLDKVGVIKAGEEKDGACAGEKKGYEQNCAKSWIEYFNQRRVIGEAQKERLARGTAMVGTATTKVSGR
ncbi:hypothetical protein AX17_002597 [Amanita inopinata Kibby_2008]|nr:hypothetical protein AX17_002597 [Amanita inopinata Kibby_2008]